jgi:hypothetical protein
MYRALTRVIMRRDGEGKQETKPCNVREPQLMKSARGGQEPEAHFMQTCQGRATPGGWPPATVHHKQEVNKGLCLCAALVYLGREGEQGAPYSSPTIYIVLPLGCIGLGNVKRKHRLICL